MNFGFTPAQRAFLDQVKTLAHEQLAPRAARYDREVLHPIESWQDLWQAGLLGITIPKAHGGLELDPLLYYATVETLATGCGATAMTLFMHSIPTRFLAAFGTAEQQARFFPEVVKAGKLFASWASEPAVSVSRKFHLETTLRPEGHSYRLDGVKHFCTMAGAASYYMVWCALADAPSLVEGLQLVLVPADRPGMEIVGDWDTLGMHGTVSPSVRFTECVVYPEELLGPPGAAIRPGGVETFGLGLTAVALGIAQGALDAAADYCRTTTFAPDNIPVAEDPAVQRHFAEMAVALEAARIMLYRAAVLAAEEPARGGVLTAQAKYVVTEASLMVTSRCIQVCGGRAAMRRLPLERAFRDVRTATLMPPSVDTMLGTIGRDVLGLGTQLYRYQ